MPDSTPCSSAVQIVPLSLNLGDLAYFDGTVELIDGDPDSTVRKVRFHRDHIVEGFPLLYCPARMQDALEMNLFMEHRYRGKFLRPKSGGHRNLKGGVTVKTLKSIANSLRGFLAWLSETDTDWSEVYAVADGDRAKAWLPPYRYKAHLISRVEAREVGLDTANLYLNHVRQFYEWALNMRRIERIPFQYKRIAIKKRRKDGDVDLLFSTLHDEKALMIQTTDLVIPKKYKSKRITTDDDLTPYSATELKYLFDSQYMRLEGRRLWAQLAFVCGLRGMEAAVFPESNVEDPALTDRTSFAVWINGKFNKDRKILVPRFLMDALWQHKNSPERLRRVVKWDQVHGTREPRPLFLNRSGQAINSASLTNITSRVAEELAMEGIGFERTFHDLRATFATTLAKFMLEQHLPLGFIQHRLMSLMGHTNFSTTQKYINFSRSMTFEKQMHDWVSRIFGELQPTLKLEAAQASEVQP